MTHKDIYTKFMIEYDKANVTSSYPSLTEYEIATILDKAYNALIAQKVTGNNMRRIPLEGDLKSISDISPLIVKSERTLKYDDTVNIMTCSIPTSDVIEYGDVLSVFPGNVTVPKRYDTGGGNYYIEQEGGDAVAYMIRTGENLQGEITCNDPTTTKFWYCFHAMYNGEFVKRGYWQEGTLDQISKLLNTISYQTNTVTYIAIVTGEDLYNLEPYQFNKISAVKINNIAKDKSPEMLYFISAYINYTVKGNKYPQDNITTRPIPVKLVNHDIAEKFIISSYNMPWIKIPVCYIEQKVLYVVYDPINKPNYDTLKLTYIKQPLKFTESLFEEDFKFECSDTMAEELISLAVAFALDNVESTRLNNKLNMRGLEA